jgi:hypothetical protein
MTTTRIFLTHCSAKKAKHTADAVPPEVLYTSQRTQRFMKRCKAVGVRWAIFSDRYGVWFPEVSHKWYEKHPGAVTESEASILLQDFDTKLIAYTKIYFYCHPARLHPLYRRLVRQSALTERIRWISHLSDIQ